MSPGLLKYSTVCERLDIGKTFLYGLIAAGILEKKTLLGVPKADGSQSKENRITLDSVERYERGEAKPAARAVMSPAGRQERTAARMPRPKPMAKRLLDTKHFQ